MNLLQSFMGCMYPVSISTESIESIGPNNPELRFQASNIDEENREQSRGELQLTDRDLIYSRPHEPPIRWPIKCIRRYGCSKDGQMFTIQSGRTTQTGEAIIAFRLSHGSELVERLKDKIERTSPSGLIKKMHKSVGHDDSENICLYNNTNSNRNNNMKNNSENILQNPTLATAANNNNVNQSNPIDQSIHHKVPRSSGTRNETAKASQMGMNTMSQATNKNSQATISETSYTDVHQATFSPKRHGSRQPPSPTRPASAATPSSSLTAAPNQHHQALSSSNSKLQPYSDININMTKSLKELAASRQR